MLLEVSSEGMQVLDSSRTNANGDFELTGNVKEAIICQLQWDDNSAVYMVVDNNTNARVEISGSGSDISYALSGKGIEASADMKGLIDINTKYILQLQNIQELAQRLPQTEESYAEATRLQQQYYAQLAERKEAIRNFALGLKKSIIPYFVIASGMLEELDFKLLEHALNAAKSYSETSKYTRDMQVRFDQEKSLTVGAIAPDIKLKQPDGKELALSSLRGKVVLIDFWASWCGPCRRENPFNRQLYYNYKNKGFEIFGVSLDQDAGRWKGAIAADSLNWYHVSDLGGWASAPAKLYKVSSIPATYLLDKEGRILAKGLRGEQLQAKLEEVFAK
jgi:thiol-disulfide isomerase/thioredoxin